MRRVFTMPTSYRPSLGTLRDHLTRQPASRAQCATRYPSCANIVALGMRTGVSKASTLCWDAPPSCMSASHSRVASAPSAQMSWAGCSTERQV